MIRLLATGLSLGLIVLVAAASGALAQSEDMPPLERSLELGADWAHYYEGIDEDLNGQFLRYFQARQDRYGFLAEIGRAEGFGEESFNYGASYTHHLPPAWRFTVGLSSGTGEIIAPEYRLDLSVGRAFLAERNLIATLGYTRIQSKGENRSDGFGLEIVHYAHPHWMYSLMARYDLGQPGDTESVLGGASLTFYQYRRSYLTAAIEFGDIAYMLVEEGEALVDFQSRSYSLLLIQYLSQRFGFHLKGSYTDTDDYRLRGLSFSLFQEF